MAAIPKPISTRGVRSAKSSTDVNATFVNTYMQPVMTHAAIQFRNLPEVGREEAISEATAAAFLNVRHALRNGNGHRLKPSMVAHFAILHVKDGRRVGGRTDSKSDVLSRKAQRLRGFKAVGLSWDSNYAFDCMRDPSSPAWKLVLLEDRSTPVPDQAAFRIDWSSFLAGQTDRTRTLLAMLGSGYRSVEIADRLGITASAICQRRKKAAREWASFQGDTEPGSAVQNDKAAPTPAGGASETAPS